MLELPPGVPGALEVRRRTAGGEPGRGEDRDDCRGSASPQPRADRRRHRRRPLDPDPDPGPAQAEADGQQRHQPRREPPRPGRHQRTRRRPLPHGELQRGGGGDAEIDMTHRCSGCGGDHDVAQVPSRLRTGRHRQLERNLGALVRRELHRGPGRANPGRRHAAAAARGQPVNLYRDRLGLGSGIGHIDGRERIALTGQGGVCQTDGSGLHANPDARVRHRNGNRERHKGGRYRERKHQSPPHMHVSHLAIRAYDSNS